MNIEVGDYVVFNNPHAAWEVTVGVKYRVIEVAANYIYIYNDASQRDCYHQVHATKAKLSAQVKVAKESDPSGIALSAPGAKADAGKLRPTLIFRDMADALALVIKVGTDGANKYSDGGWLQVPSAATRYDDADLRHMLKRYIGELTDSDSESLHLAHEAWNALAKLQLFLVNNPQHKAKL